MKKRALRGISFALSLLLLCSVLSVFGTLSVGAESDERRFIFSSLVSAGGQSYAVDQENALVLELSATDKSFKAKDIVTMGNNNSTNVLYIALINRSNATTLRINYDYGANMPSHQTVEQVIAPDSAQKQSFVLHTPHISDALSGISISFGGEGEVTGSVELYSFFDVSVYEASTENEATIESCLYVKERQVIEISGELSYAATVLYAGETLALFALAPDEDLYLSNKTPVARMGVSFAFSFSLEVTSAEAIYSRYVVAAVTQKGERIPLCTPIYPDIAAAPAPSDIGFKGFHTDSLFSVIDSGAELEIVDVYLDRLQSEQSGGILYAGAHSYYYFNETYVNELDRRVQNLSGAGCSVYLRFLISPDANGFPFVSYTEESSGILNKGILVNSEQALLAVHAFTDFLTLRYADGSKGNITGIIIGRRADQASIYGYVGAMGLDAYVERYATSLNLIAGAGRNNIPGLHIVLPVSDTMWLDTVTPENLTGMYFSELFLISLLEALNTCVINPPTFSVMLESDSAPDLLSKTENTYGSDRISAFLTIIEQYANFYSFLDRSILYSWTPQESLSDEQLCAAYALQYIGLKLNDRVRSFIVDFSLAEASGDRSDAKTLQYLATYIDTYKTASATESVLNTLGIDSFSEIYLTYNENALYNRQLIRVELDKAGYQSGAAVKGSYELWNFATVTELQNWYEGHACDDLSVLGRALNARFSSHITSDEYAEIAYHFEQIKDISFAPLMRFTVGLDGVQNVPYEVQIRLIGEDMTIISSAVISSGDTQDLYLDLSSYARQLMQLRGIRICARPLAQGVADYNFRLHTVTLESSVLTDDELAARMTADLNASNNNEGADKKDYTTPIVVTVLIILVSIAITVFLIIRHRTRYNRKMGKISHSDENHEEKNT